MIDLWIVLDSGPLELITNTSGTAENLRAWAWMWTLPNTTAVVVPEITDYEVRRELIRADKELGIERLDRLCRLLRYEPLTTNDMRLAARFWAQARNAARPGVRPESIDADRVLAAQAVALRATGARVLVATENVSHIQPFVEAKPWHEIT